MTSVWRVSEAPDLKKDKDLCAFCETQQKLCVSHIIPAFVFKWLKDTGGTPHLRFSLQPNKRAQDGIKSPLLCHKCENTFGALEKKFSETIFVPFTQDRVTRVRYSEWLAKFCCSISWRLLTTFSRNAEFGTLSSEQKAAVDNALSQWKDFIRGRAENPGRFEQHFLFFPAVGHTNVTGLPTNINRFLARTVEFDFVHNNRFFSTYCKMGPFILFGFIIPHPIKWTGTRVAVRSGEFPSPKCRLTIDVRDYLISRAEKQTEMYASISEIQKQKIEDSISRNADAFIKSKQFEAMMLDAEMFGIDAILAK